MPRPHVDHSFWKRNGLSIVLCILFLAMLVGQVVAGRATLDEERAKHGLSALSVLDYLRSGSFVSATFENWESEFLQMGMYVLLTVRLRQKGSAESRPFNPSQEQPRIDRGATPWPLRRGGWAARLYENSLSLALLLLFAGSMVLHLLGSWRHAVEQRAMEGEPPIGLWQHATGAQFWFESLQNWQSEYLAVLALVLLSIVLRQKDSPESKPVEAPHAQTGA